jgi:hypothetical protein
VGVAARRSATLVAVLSALGSVLLTAAPAATASGPGDSRTNVGSAPAVPSSNVGQGATSASRSLQLTVTLQPSDTSALAAYVADVSTPGNSLYRHYLSPSQFASRFGAGSQAIADVRSSLSAQGLTLGPTAANGLSIPVTGSVGTIQKAFATSFDNYQQPSGRVAYANTTAPSLPPAIAGDVQGILGLDDLYQSQTGPQPTPVPASTYLATKASPQTTGGATWTGSCGSYRGVWTANQLAGAYSMSSLSNQGLNGDGITVGLYELSNYQLSDITKYESCYSYGGGHPNPAISNVIVDGGALNTDGSDEVTLDIEDVLGLAPGANIVVYEGPNSGSGGYDTYSQMISDDTSQVISTSWGLCEADMTKSGASAQNTLFQEAAVQGQTILAAAGDDGSSDCDGSPNYNLAVDDPASQPYVTGVGGTDLTALTPTETVWNGGCSDGPCGGGGGISKFWTMPTWQQSAVIGVSSGTPCGAAAGSYCRQVPDVTASASPANGYIIYYDGGWGAFGGTSAAAPLWAAFIAQVDQCTGAASPVGFINPVLYQHPGDVHDVTTGNNHINSAAPTGDWTAGTGYDLASGLGSPNASALLNDFCSPAPVPSVSSVSPSSGTSSGGTSVTITGSGFTGAAAVTFGGTAAATFIVVSDTTITVTSPAHAPGVANVRVTGPGGQSPTVTPDQFTYALTFTVAGPSAGTTAGSATTAANATADTADAARQISVTPSTLGSASMPLTLSLAGSSAYFANPGTGYALSNNNQTATCSTVANCASTLFVDDAVAESATLGGSDGSGDTAVTTLTFNGIDYSLSSGACPTNDVDTTTNCMTQGQVGAPISVTVHYAAGQNGSNDSDGAFRQVVLTVTGPSGGGSPAITGASPSTPNSITCTTDASGNCSLTIVDTNPVDTDDTSVSGHKGHDTITVAISGTSAVPYPAVGSIGSGMATSGSQAALNMTSATAAPALSGLSPTSGSTAGGTSVTITGTGFTGATAVTFGGTAAKSFSVKSDTKVVAVSSAHGAATTNVRVTGPGGQSAVVTPADQFTYAAPQVVPVVSGVSPASGLPAGGTRVSVTGSGFTAASTVAFGGVAAASVSFVSSTELDVMSPAHAAGTTNVRVTTKAGQSAVVTPADQFTYAGVPKITKLAPKSGPAAGGMPVTITGTGFTPDATVSFGSGDPAPSVTYVSATELIAVSPPHAATSGYVNVTVTTGSGSSAVVTADHYKYS